MMRIRRTTRLLVEPPASATGDIAFNLIVFFLVCASVQPDSGREQMLPRSEEVADEQQAENIEVTLTRRGVVVNGDPVTSRQLEPRLRELLQGKTRQEDRVVVVKSTSDTPYRHWITVTAMIENAGGIVTIQREEERQVVLPE